MEVASASECSGLSVRRRITLSPQNRAALFASAIRNAITFSQESKDILRKRNCASQVKEVLF